MEGRKRREGNRERETERSDGVGRAQGNRTASVLLVELETLQHCVSGLPPESITHLSLSSGARVVQHTDTQTHRHAEREAAQAGNMKQNSKVTHIFSVSMMYTIGG